MYVQIPACQYVVQSVLIVSLSNASALLLPLVCQTDIYIYTVYIYIHIYVRVCEYRLY